MEDAIDPKKPMKRLKGKGTQRLMKTNRRRWTHEPPNT
jgi:hypothetical protein